MKVTITDTGPGVESFLEELVNIPAEVEAGYFEPEIARVALAHEFGTDTIPRRATLRPTTDREGQAWADVARDGVRASLQGVPPEAALAPLGVRMVSDLRAAQVALQSPPLDPETVADKGSSNPLVDTGRLQAAIEFKIRRR